MSPLGNTTGVGKESGILKHEATAVQTPPAQDVEKEQVVKSKRGQLLKKVVRTIIGGPLAIALFVPGAPIFGLSLLATKSMLNSSSIRKQQIAKSALILSALPLFASIATVNWITDQNYLTKFFLTFFFRHLSRGDIL